MFYFKMGSWKVKFIFTILCAVGYKLGSSEEIHNDNRIIGGTPANNSEFPYQVSIQRLFDDNYVHHCGGALVSAKYVVTAARCVLDYHENGTFTAANHTLYRAHVALVDLSSEVAPLEVSNIIVHPDFNFKSDGLENDIAILELGVEKTTGSALTMATSDPSTGTQCIVTGWGLNASDAVEYQNHLLKVQEPLIEQDACSVFHEFWGSTFNLTEKMICAGFGNDACLGDTGAPLVCNDQLTGLAIWDSCSSGVVASTVFIRISQYREWIEKSIANGAYAVLPSAVTVAALAIAHLFYTLS